MNWPLVELANVCEIVSGATPRRDVPEYWGNDVPWVTPKDISRLNQPTLEDAPEYISFKGLRSCSATLLPKGTILLSSRAPIGLVAIAGREMCTNQGFKSLVPGPNIHGPYLYHLMKASAQRLNDLGTGATFKEVSKKVVGGFQIPLPPFDAQHRIASILDKADGIRRKRQEALKHLDDFLRATFLDMFGDPAKNPKGWPIGTIRDLVENVKYGTSQKAHPEAKGFPVLRMGNITVDGALDVSDLKYVELSSADQRKYLAQKRDILFNRTNSKDLVGKTTVFDLDTPYAFAGYLVRAKPKVGVSPYYVSAYLNSAHGKQTLRSRCKSIVGMANINAQELQEIPIVLPPPRLQSRYEAVVLAARSNQNQMNRACEEANDLFASLSQRAFAGEL
ncbi:restriction endonuclease subunit S [Kordiimonas sp.]|uniref:restriction endonuclease subunit S n=1 Tax=Kordiimonas sp. TaxID=1970157 RepID=UPI003A90E70F